MSGRDAVLLLAGAGAWLVVAAIAVLAVQRDEGWLGFLPVFAAVLAAWAAGEWLLRARTGEEGS